MQLSKEHISLPAVSVRDNPQLSSDEFVLYFGALKLNGNYINSNIIQILYNCAKEYQPSEFTHDGINNIFQEGVKYLQEKNFQKAIYEFAKAYYCASFSLETRAIMVNSMINISGIQIFNKQYDSALQSGLRACALAISDNFYDPYLKYYSTICTGIVYIHLKNWTAATEYFQLAYDIIKATNENALTISALSVMTQIYMQEYKLTDSAACIDKILDILQEDKTLEFSNDFIIFLARYQTQIYKSLLAQQASDYENLYRKYKKLSTNFLIQLKNCALNIIYESRGIIVPLALGTLLGGDHYFQAQISFGGANIKSVNTLTITEN